MNELALFAGAGGGLLGSKLLGWRTVCAVEINPYRQAVLLARQQDGLLDPFPIWSDIRSFDGRQWRGLVDVVTAGFPCQPFSVAGKRRGADDERNGWPDTIRVIREVGPEYAFLENVPGLIAHGYFGTVLGDLAEAGFDAEWCVLGADDVGAPHIRKRLWILAYSNAARVAEFSGDEADRTSDREPCGTRGTTGTDVADAGRAGHEPDGRSGETCRTTETPQAQVEERKRCGHAAGDGGEDVADAAQHRRTRGGECARRWIERTQGREGKGDVAHAECARLEVRQGISGDDAAQRASVERTGCEWWRIDPAEDPAAESYVGGVVDELAAGMDEPGAAE